ncbi:hypothetical protein GXW78_04725 [Roseomonas terrae]|uniref:DUF4129 domain-containing protein n=1 Tax=Neoroseomonas terrae TaxID=424799 RepID=A0ABS5ED57_9PROT|nr:hypothetical protein [Neoroseomonas terrae]MBR0648955.1 hypothetical protein [Neoroseomonas terrae]
MVDRSAALPMMGGMDDPSLTLLAVAIGLFYVVAGLMLLRRLPAEAMLDQMLAALGDGSAPAERRRTQIWMLGGTLVFASGLSLAVLSRWAPAFFVAAALLQAGYLAWASRALPTADEATRRGRRSVVQALVVYTVATAIVLWLDRQGVWRAWIEPPLLELPALLGIAAAVAGLLLRQAFWTALALPFAGPLSPSGPRMVRLQPAFGLPPLRDHAQDALIDAADLDLDGALVARIAAWDAQFQGCVETEPPSFPDLAAEQAWFEEGLSIAGDIQASWMGTLITELSALDAMLEEARGGLDVTVPTPIAAAAGLACRCGVAEIRDMLSRLDGLSWEKAELPDRDGDAQDDVARAQLFFAEVLAHLPPRYLPEIRRGLDSPQAETRRWVELALAKRGEG